MGLLWITNSWITHWGESCIPQQLREEGKENEKKKGGGGGGGGIEERIEGAKKGGKMKKRAQTWI